MPNHNPSKGWTIGAAVYAACLMLLEAAAQTAMAKAAESADGGTSPLGDVLRGIGHHPLSAVAAGGLGMVFFCWKISTPKYEASMAESRRAYGDKYGPSLDRYNQMRADAETMDAALHAMEPFFKRIPDTAPEPPGTPNGQVYIDRWAAWNEALNSIQWGVSLIDQRLPPSVRAALRDLPATVDRSLSLKAVDLRWVAIVIRALQYEQSLKAATALMWNELSKEAERLHTA